MTQKHNLTYDAEKNLYFGADGAAYVECKFETRNPTMIRVDCDVWTVKFSGQTQRLDWLQPKLPNQIKQAFRVATIHKLTKVAPSYITVIHRMLRSIALVWDQHTPKKADSFSGLDASHLVSIATNIPRHDASAFRELYRALAVRGLHSCSLNKSKILADIRLNKVSSGALPDVRRWHTSRGSLTTSELEHFRAHLVVRDPDESDHAHFTRVYLRTAVAVGKRAVQLLHALPDALKSISGDTRYQKFIVIPGGKSQRNEKPAYWPIGEDHYEDLLAFAERPAIAEAQAYFGYFFVTPMRSQSRVEGPKHAGSTQTLIKDWIERGNLISPRTGEILEVTTTRLRHTVATQMAKKGYSKGDIQAMLEHKSGSAALAYIDAVGNDLTPALERVDEALGGIFSNLSNAFFKGTVIDRPVEKVSKPVMRPDPLNIAIVGQCGAATSCPKHPFFSCYNGCPYFLRFRDTDENANRTFIEKEYQRWRAAEPSATHSKALDDFARLDQAMREAEERGEQ